MPYTSKKVPKGGLKRFLCYEYIAGIQMKIVLYKPKMDRNLKPKSDKRKEGWNCLFLSTDSLCLKVISVG